MTPHVRVICHGAERTGPPIYLARILRAWAADPPPFTTSVDVARPGPLVDEFRAFADVRVARLDRAAPARRAARRVDRIDRSGRTGDLLRAVARRRHLPERRRLPGGHSATADRPPSLVVINGATAPTAELLADVPVDRPVVMIAHELATGWLHNIGEADRRMFLARCRAYLAVSDAVRSYLVDLGVPPSAVTVVRGPVNRRVRSPRAGAPRRGWRILGMGVTDWRKAPADWLRVVARVASLVGDVGGTADWFGGVVPSPSASTAAWALEMQRRRLGLAELARFHGELADPWQVVESTLVPTVFVSTAVEDAAPLVVYEAAAAGIPVVTFDGGGAAEFVDLADAGIVCPYPDIAAAADAVAQLLGDPERLALLGHNGAVFADRELRADRTAARISDWIVAVLDDHGERTT